FLVGLCLVYRYPPPPRATLFPYTTLFRSSPGTIGRLPVEAVAAIRSVGGVRQLASVGRPDLLAFNGVVDGDAGGHAPLQVVDPEDRKSTRLNSSHVKISYAVFCLKKKRKS